MRALALVFALCCALASAHAHARVLHVCADPDNLPFSNAKREGFENRIAELVARDLGATVEYTWWAQRRGFARNTLGAGRCELWPGVASAVETMRTTAPYYRSSYVFVTRRESALDIASFDDPRLKTLTVGVQMIGNDATNTPPAHALARRGIATNVRGFMVYDVGEREGASPIVDAVADGKVDVAVVWGPVAGYFARRSNVPLRLTPTPPSDGSAWPMAFDISMGVAKGNAALAAEIDAVLAHERPAIDAILDEFGVPRAEAAAPSSAMSGLPPL